MATTRIALLIVVLLLTAPCGAPADTPAGLVPPLAIHLPYGGRIVTEINLTDNDVLGIIKRAIPAAAEAVRGLVTEMSACNGEGRAGLPLGPPELAMISAIDAEGLVQAIEGIRGIRIIAASYNSKINPAAFVSQFDAGVAKLGSFSRVVYDAAISPGGFGLYVEGNNQGYIGFAVDPSMRAVYAARISGFVDVEKLVEWAAKTARIFLAGRLEVTSPLPPANSGAQD